MTMFGITPRSVEQVLQLDGKRYFLASQEQANQLGVTRSWNVKRVPRQESDPTQEFTIPLPTFHNGYGYSFADKAGVYEIASGWDLSAPGKATTYPLLTTGSSVTSTDYRGWLIWDATSGYMYMLRGSYSAKYTPDDTTSTWAIVEYHYFGANIVVAGRPANFQGKWYVPLVDISTSPETLARWHELGTISTTTVEVQTWTESGTPTGGTFVMRWSDGLTTTDTSALAYNATAADVQTAVQAIPGLQDVTVTRSGASNFVWTLTMTRAPGSLATTSPAQFTLQTNGLTGGATPTITPATTSAGVSDQWNRGAASTEARTFCVWQKPSVGPVLVRANSNTVSTCSTTPTTGANWGTAQEVGDSGARINALATLGRLLFVGKTDGIWSFDETGQAVNEIPAISAIRDNHNCVGMVEYNGYLLIPHKVGTIRWRPGTNWAVIGAEPEGAYEGDRSSGWGQISGLAPYGRYCYISGNDAYNTLGVIGSLQAPGGVRGPLTPHMHQTLADGYFEDCAVVGISSQPVNANVPSTFSDDNAVGTVAWTDVSNAGSDSLYATTASTGTTHYLKGLNPNPAVPTNATINGIKLSLTKVAYGGVSSTTTKSYTGGSQTYVVPAGVTSLIVDARGGAGGTGRSGAAGGYGARVVTTITVTPGETLTIKVGGKGANGGTDNGSNGAGGYPTGGAGASSGAGTIAGGGGGSSEVLRSSTRLVVAAGGGGASRLAGGAGGENGTSGSSLYGGPGGGAFTNLAGFGGTGYGGGNDGSNGSSSGTGGAGGSQGSTNVSTSDGGGGGGGGYYGGGGGGGAQTTGATNTYAGGGGGGSSYSSGSSTVFTSAYNASNGSVTLTTVITTDIVDSTVKLVKAGSVTGSNYASASQWSQSGATTEYGSATDLWGTTWTPAQVNATTFGFVMNAVVTTGTPRVSGATMYIYYTVQGQSDPGSFLAVIKLDTTKTIATPYIYKLPRAGLPAANDPNISKATSNAYFTTSRYYAPSRSVQKEYRSVEFYVDLDPSSGNTPGLQMWASVGDGDFFPLQDADGNTATITTSGDQELFFPPTTSAIGRWVQLKPLIPSLSSDQVAVAVDLREITVHGAWLPKMTEEITATVVLRESGQFEDGFTDTRSLAQQLSDLNDLNAPRPAGSAPIVLRDPVQRSSGRCVVTDVQLRPVQFKSSHEEVWVATLQIRKAVYP